MTGRTLFIDDSSRHGLTLSVGDAPELAAIRPPFDLLLHDIDVEARPLDSRDLSADPTSSPN